MFPRIERRGNDISAAATLSSTGRVHGERRGGVDRHWRGRPHLSGRAGDNDRANEDEGGACPVLHSWQAGQASSQLVPSEARDLAAMGRSSSWLSTRPPLTIPSQW